MSSLGDWIGLVAVLSITARVGGGSPETAIALVMSARMIPGFFLASLGGVLVDRWNRKTVMVVCDIGRGLTLATLPFVESVWGLFLVSLVLELFTLLWSPAKEASVPNLVKVDKLPAANSFSLAAAYGTFPVGSALFAFLAKVAEWLGRGEGPLHFLELNQESLAIYLDVGTFLTSAFIISTIALPRTKAPRRRSPAPLTDAFNEVKEGWRFIGTSPVVRSVMVGLGTGLIGGGMVAPLGPVFSAQVLHSGSAGFALMLTALGMGLAVGVVGLSLRAEPAAPPADLPPGRAGGGGVHAGRVVDVAAGAVPDVHRGDGRVRGGGLRPRLHHPPGERGRRPAGTHLRRPLHPLPAVPAHLPGPGAPAGGHPRPAVGER